MASVQAGAMEDQAKPEATFAIRLWIHRIHRSHGDQQWSKKSQSPSDDGAIVFVEALVGIVKSFGGRHRR